MLSRVLARASSAHLHHERGTWCRLHGAGQQAEQDGVPHIKYHDERCPSFPAADSPSSANGTRPTKIAAHKLPFLPAICNRLSRYHSGRDCRRQTALGIDHVPRLSSTSHTVERWPGFRRSMGEQAWKAPRPPGSRASLRSGPCMPSRETDFELCSQPPAVVIPPDSKAAAEPELSTL